MDDLISRQQAIEIVKRYNKSHMVLKQQPMLGAASIVIELEELPSVQPERKTGRWIESNPQDSKVCRLMTCSECGKAYIVNIDIPYEDWTEAHKFCVECGAKMEGGDSK